MKQLTVIRTEIGAGKQSSMESSIVNTMHVYFQSDKRKMGNLEQAIMNSVKKYFKEKQPPKEAA
jgi:hypothetical protein